MFECKYELFKMNYDNTLFIGKWECNENWKASVEHLR